MLALLWALIGGFVIPAYTGIIGLNYKVIKWLTEYNGTSNVFSEQYSLVIAFLS